MRSFFGLDNREMPWGDYGSILLSGMVGHRSTKRGLLQLERTGPYVPPFVDSGVNEYVLTDALRRELEATDFLGLGFQEVIKARITHVPWKTWNLGAEEPEFYPGTGEPEGYMLDQWHRPLMARRMGPLWSFRPERSIHVRDGKLYGDDPEGADVVGYDAYGGRFWAYFSPRLAEWLIEHADGNVVLGSEYPFRPGPPPGG